MKNLALTPDQQNAMDTIRAVYADQEAEINGRKYRFTSMVHKERRKVFAYMSSIQDAMANKDFRFLEAPDFQPIEDILMSRTLFNDSALNKIGGHWEKYPGDYLTFIVITMQVICFPFMAGGDID